MAYILQDTELLTVKLVKTEDNEGVFEIEPLSPGYGVTVGNSLRRVLLSSIEGAAPTAMRIEGATHEFTTIDGIKEDLVEITLNVKELKVRSFSNEPVQLILEKKGPGVVTAGDFKKNAQVEFVDPTQPICTLDKNGKLSMELTVERGRGYLPTESRKDEKLPLGAIALDSMFSPVVRVNYDISNTRVGQLTNYDKVTMGITTDDTIAPEEALQRAATILVEHFGIIAGLKQQAEADLTTDGAVPTEEAVTKGVVEEAMAETEPTKVTKTRTARSKKAAAETESETE